ncbi:unnamed protein product [Effrenium voratum]|nr:unnamed protein product [Effrenium voratum]
MARLPRSLLLMLACAFSQVAFVGPANREEPRSASRVPLRAEIPLEREATSDTRTIEETVEALREQSLEACLLASEENAEALERCEELCYELNSAEQLLFKRRQDFRYLESDSF